MPPPRENPFPPPPDDRLLQLSQAFMAQIMSTNSTTSRITRALPVPPPPLKLPPLLAPGPPGGRPKPWARASHAMGVERLQRTSVALASRESTSPPAVKSRTIVVSPTSHFQ